MSKNYYIADLHLFDEATLRQTKRPFKTTADIMAAMQIEWNKKVRPFEHVYILGDVAHWGLNMSRDKVRAFARYMDSLNGRKVLIIGNHDGRNLEVKEFRDCFYRINTRIEMRDGDHKVFLDHYPVEDWNGLHTGTIHLHGHVHNNPVREIPNRYNVAIDAIGLAPVTLEELITKKKGEKF